MKGIDTLQQHKINFASENNPKFILPILDAQYHNPERFNKTRKSSDTV